MNYHRNKLAFAIGLASNLNLSLPVAAQSQNVEKWAQLSELEEIVVTARRREETIQEVPISITVLDGDALEKASIAQTEGLQFLVPSLTLSAAGSLKETMAVSLRGQYNADVLGVSDAPVAVYFADTLISRPLGTNLALYDLAGVQVLKGVQGTLFGRNTTGGAIVVTPNLPGDNLEVNIKSSLGNFDHREVFGMANIPLSDKLAIRIASLVRERDGIFENRATGTRFESRDLQSWRVSLRWKPTDAIESTTIYDYYDHDQTGSGSSVIEFNPAAPAIAGHNFFRAASTNNAVLGANPNFANAASYFTANGLTAVEVFPTLANFNDLDALVAQQQALSNPGDFYSDAGSGIVNRDLLGDSRSKAENRGIQNTTSFELSIFTLKNMLAYREVELDTVTDLDGSLFGGISAQQGGQYDFVSNELQMLGTTRESKLDWIVGLYYMNESGDDYGISNQFNELTVEGTRLGAFSALVPAINGGVMTFDQAVAAANGAAAGASSLKQTSADAENTSAAIYTGLTYRIDETWTLAGGLRYTEDKRETAATSRIIFVNTGVVTCDFEGLDQAPIEQCKVPAEEDFDAFTYDTTLSYFFAGSSMVYGSFRHGYRTGGFSGRARTFAQLTPFEPEEVDEFELGFKADFQLAGVPVRANGAVFYQDYQEIQRQVAVDLGNDTIATIIQNAAAAKTHGGELELTVVPSDRLNLSFFYSFIDGSYDEYTDPATGTDLSDQWVIWAPKHMVGVTLSYQQPLVNMGELVWTANLYSQSEQHLDDMDSVADQEAYTLAGARIDWQSVAGSNFDIAIWGLNLTDEEYRVGSVSILESSGTSAVLLGEARTYGLDVIYRYGN